MTRQHMVVLVFALLVVLLAGCPERQAQQPMDPPDTPPAEMQDSRIQLTAYINVASGCQVPTIELLEELVDQHSDRVDMEMVDFGSRPGLKRMKEDGVNCLTLLFDGSPVIRIPGEDGEKRVIAFYYPAGFGWVHEDLEQTFAAIGSGEAEILSEEEARKVLAPVAIEMTVAVKETDEGVDVLMNGDVAFTITQEAGGQTPLERAEAARSALEAWTSEPVHPHQVKLTDVEDGWSIFGAGEELARVYKADAEAAGVEPGKKLAAEWVRGIKESITTAARDGQEGGGDDDIVDLPCC